MLGLIYWKSKLASIRALPQGCLLDVCAVKHRHAPGMHRSAHIHLQFVLGGELNCLFSADHRRTY